MYYSDQTIVFLNGRYINAKEATTSLYSQTMHYGNGVFEGIRSYTTPEGTSIFKAREHYERLLYSAKKMHIRLNYSSQELEGITYTLLKKNNLSNAYIRPLVYLNENMSLTPADGTNLFIAAWEWGSYLGNELQRVMLSSYQRPNPKSCYIDAKIAGHYTNSILAATEAKLSGFDEALLLDADGFVAEGSAANFFYEKEGVLFTPCKTNILPGITRATIFELADELGFSVKEQQFTPDVLKEADSAFFCGTAAEVAGIASLDNIPFKKQWEDSLGYIIQKGYKKLVTQKRKLTVA